MRTHKGRPTGSWEVLHRFGFILGGLLVGFVIAEVIVKYCFFTESQRVEGVATLYRSQEGVDFSSYEKEHPGCTFDDSLIAHPFLGFVHHSFPPCGEANISKEGFEGGRDMPRYRDPHYFTILVVGTSVAAQLSSFKSPSGRFLMEEVFNQNFVSPTGKPFRVLVGAIGSSSRPDANASSLLYGDIADGIISIDGYNETNASKKGSSLTFPAPSYTRMILTPYSLELQIQKAIAFKIRNLCKNGPILKNSFLAFYFQRELITNELKKWHDSSFQKLASQTYYSQFYKPANETLEQSLLWNRKKYEGLIRANDAVARSLGAKFAHFLQPIPAFKKHLTESERQAPLTTTQGEYQNFIDAIDDLKKEHLPVFSLVHLFDNAEVTIYGDSIHCAWLNGDNPGYRIMAKEIGKRLVEAWKLKER